MISRVKSTWTTLYYKDYCFKKRNWLITAFVCSFPVLIFLSFLGSIGQPIRDIK